MKINKIILSKECTVQIEAYSPVTSGVTLEAILSPTDDLEKCHAEINEKLQKWTEFEILKWKSPNRAITAGRKLGLYSPLPGKNDENIYKAEAPKAAYN